MCAAPSDEAAPAELSESPPAGTMYIKQYRVKGVGTLPQGQVEEAVYPFLGPGRTEADVEGARAALEDAYRKAGFQTVTVGVPEQRPTRGIILLEVTESKVGRLRVVGAKYHDVEKIRDRVPSLAEGSVPNFEQVQKDIVALNQSADLVVTPTIKPGAAPGTVDVDLQVKDLLPLHGSVELNNRYSANTVPLRLNLDLRYSNLWQLGHTIGVGYQVAPERPEDAKVYSAYYIAPVPTLDWLSVLVQAIRQNSDVSTLGGSAVAGNGEVVGGRLLFDLPGKKGFFHSASLGVDYKHFLQDLTLGEDLVNSPVTYWPLVASYNASIFGEGRLTSFDGTVTAAFRGLGSEQVEFDNRRFDADGSFISFRGGISHQQDLPHGFQIYGAVEGQASGYPLVDSEQFALGGQTTVRGYLESEVLGDSGVTGTFELRTPSLLGWVPGKHELRLFAFMDGGLAYVNHPLPEQTTSFELWSYGFGANMAIAGHLNGMIVVGMPMVSAEPTDAGNAFVSFRVWGEL